MKNIFESSIVDWVTPCNPGLESLKDFHLTIDTEYAQKPYGMEVLSVGALGTLMPGNTCVCDREDFGDDFNIINLYLKTFGLDVKVFSDDEMTALQKHLDEETLEFLSMVEGVSPKKVGGFFKRELANGRWDDLTNYYGLPRESLILAKYKHGRSIELKPIKLTVTLEFFYAQADLFKIWGKNWHWLILSAHISQYRVFKLMKPLNYYMRINGTLIEINLKLSDNIAKIPPGDRSLDGQCRTFKVQTQKLDIVTRELARMLGVDNPDLIKAMMDLLAEYDPELLAMYNAIDIQATHELGIQLQIFWDRICDDLGLPRMELAQTTGRNVSNIMVGLVQQGFEGYPDSEGIVKNLLKLPRLENVQDINENRFGIQPFLTQGGLLFSRVARYPKIVGSLGDLDLSSCYATTMSGMNIYIGEPCVRTFKYEGKKPTLARILKLVERQRCPKDGWFARVSGDFEVVTNTLLMSDLKFNFEKRVRIPDSKKIDPNRKSIEYQNFDKVSKVSASAAIFKKQAKFAVVTHHTIQAIKLLPPEWLNEYLNLYVDAIVYYPAQNIHDDLESWAEQEALLPKDPEDVILMDNESDDYIRVSKRYKPQASLRFPIGEHWSEVKRIRTGYKKQKDPIQEVYKLIGNSGYGALACPYLPVNNHVASNYITGAARACAWMMVNALNGFSPITDGTTFSWDTVPLGLKFHELLGTTPNYLAEYDPSIQSGLPVSQHNQTWIDVNYKLHLSEFYGVPLNHELIELFGYELKEESFVTKAGAESLEDWRKSLEFTPTESEIVTYLKSINGFKNTTNFNTYINTGAGNYVKGIDSDYVLIEGQDYDFVSQTSQIKARSYSSRRDPGILPWYVSAVGDTYTEPYLYTETALIDLAEAKVIAVRLLLKEGVDEIAQPTGFSKQVLKIMKLVSRSQFLFLNEAQLNNFQRNVEALSKVSTNLLTPSFWRNFKCDEMREGIDYYKFSKAHPVGLGFEAMALLKRHGGSIESVRNELQDVIDGGCMDFNQKLHISRDVFKRLERFSEIFGLAIVRKANYENDLKLTLIGATNETMCTSIRKENIIQYNSQWVTD